MMMKTLKGQLWLWAILLVVVPSLLIMAIYTVYQIKAARQEKLDLLSQQVYFEQRLIEDWLAERTADVRYLSQQRSFKTKDEQQIEYHLRLVQQGNPDFDSLIYTDKNGTVKSFTAGDWGPRSTVSDSPYFQAAASGKEYISNIFVVQASEVPMLAIAAPCYSYAGDLEGVVVGFLKMSALEKIVRYNPIGETGEVFLVNQEGVMITEPRYVNMLIERGLVKDTARMKFKITQDAFRNIRLDGTGEATWIDYLDNRVLGAYRLMPERGWTIIGKIKEGEILAPIYAQAGFMSGSIILMVLAILPMSVLVTNRIKRPIDWLIEQSNLVAAGNYASIGQEKNLLAKMPQEIRDLCETFIAMTCKIENTVGLLKAHEVKLEESNKELKTFAYIVSHDLRAPLVNLKGFSQELGYALTDLKRIINDPTTRDSVSSGKAVDALLDKDVPEALGFIHASVDKMDRMTTALLKLSRFGRRELNYEKINMNDIVSVVLQSYNHQIEQKNIQVQVGPLPQIKSDHLAMEQIISNLLDNAIKYLKPGRRGEIEIYCTDNGDEFIFDVRDNGRGIAAEHQERIFDIFRRAGKQDVSGEGMGLAYVRSVILQLGGRVWCESNLGAGTMISFTVPSSPSSLKP